MLDARYLQFVALSTNGVNGVGLNEIAVFGPLANGALLPGDYNGNGLVEQEDLDLVLANWGDPAASAPGTWINDPPEGNIDQTELDKVLANWGNASARGSNLVPEPGSGLVVLVCLSLLAARSRWRSPRLPTQDRPVGKDDENGAPALL